MKRKTLGIPFLVVVAVAVVALAGGAVLGSLFFTQSQGGHVKVAGSGLSLFQDAECTIPLLETDILEFGEIEASQISTLSPVIYAKNTGTFPVFISMSSSGLPVYLTVSTGGAIIPTAPDDLPIGSGLDILIAPAILGINGDESTILLDCSIAAVKTALGYPVETPDAEVAGIIQITDELVIFSSMVVGAAGQDSLTGLTWGAYGTIHVPHPPGEREGGIGLDFVPSLLEAEVLAITLDMTAGSDVEFSDKTFDITLTAGRYFED